MRLGISHLRGWGAADTWRAAALYTVLTLIMAWPLPLHPATRVVNNDPDTELYVWTLAWDAHALAHDPLGIFDANMYYPNRHTLAYSENLIGSALLVAPILWLGGSPILALNVVVLLSCMLCGLGAYVLGKRLGMGPPAAFVCGLIFAFSPPRFLRIEQAHLTTVQWIPFALAYLHSYLDKGRPRDLHLTVAFFTLEALTSGHGALFLSVAGLGLLVYRMALGEPIVPLRRLKDFGVTGALLLAPTVLCAIPYFQIQDRAELRRPLGWGTSWTSFLASPSYVQQFLLSFVPSWHVLETAQASLFPGVLPLVLAAAAVLWPRARAADGPLREPVRGVWWARAGAALEVVAVAALALALYVTIFGPIRWKVEGLLLLRVGNSLRAWLLAAVAVAARYALLEHAPLAFGARIRRRFDQARACARRHRRNPVTFYLLLAVVSLWLAAGRPLGLWSLVYWMPGFSFIRAESRFTILTVLAVGVLAGLAVERLSLRLAPRRPVAVAAVLSVLLLGEFACGPLGSATIPIEPPEVEQWLAGQPKPFVIVELPTTSYERLQSTYLLYSMAHWQKMVNGYSGTRPAFHRELFGELRDFPMQRTLERLVSLGVDYAVIHPGWYPDGEWARVEPQLAQFPDWMTLVHEGPDGRVYRLHTPDRRP